MIVQHYDRTGAKLERTLHNFAGIDRRMINGAALLFFISD